MDSGCQQAHCVKAAMAGIQASNLMILLFFTARTCYGSIEMSTTDLEAALLIQKRISNKLNDFRSPEEDARHLQEYRSNYHELTNNLQEEGFDDPVHAYLLLRHMTVDYEQITRRVTSPKTKDLLKNITSTFMRSKYPTGKDMEAAALSLIRLQNVYDLSTKFLLANNHSKNQALTAADCFRLGSQAVLTVNLKLAHNWFEEGLKLLGSNQEPEGVSEETKNAVESQYEAIGHILSYGNMFEGLLSDAVRNAPSHILDMVNFIPGLPDNFFKKVKESIPSEGHLEYFVDYKKLCQGQVLMDPQQSKELLCAYVRGGHPRFIMAPNKVEVLSYDPVVVVYHDVIGDKEIEHLKSVSKERLFVTKTKSSQDLEELVTFARTGKMAFLPDNEDLRLIHLSEKISHVTGLNVDYAENWQVVNYGIGGHYEVHYDFFDFLKRNVSFPGGDRLATMLFYLNDVKAGGHTVFPALKFGVRPKKGSALFWYNLKKSGYGNYQTVHAACPILSGTKWISNKWFRTHGNEIIRPCTIDSEE